AEQPPDRLPERLAQDVPERDVDATDRMGHRAAASGPEGVLVQLLADALGLKRVLPAPQRLEQIDCRLDEAAIGEDAAMAGDAGIGVHGDQGMDRVLRRDLLRPATLRARPRQGDDGYRTNTDGFHGERLPSGVPTLRGWGGDRQAWLGVCDGRVAVILACTHRRQHSVAPAGCIPSRNNNAVIAGLDPAIQTAAAAGWMPGSS